MTTDSWIQLDDQRAAWSFLILGSQTETKPNYIDSNQDYQPLTYWEVGVGNAEGLVETTAKRVDDDRITDESQLIESLFTKLDQYRYDDTTIITPDSRTLARLRQRIISETTGSSPSLRGFTHLDIQTVLSEYFEKDLSEFGIDRESRTLPRRTETGVDQVVSTGSVRDLSSVWNRIFRLIPASDLTGQRL